MSEASKIFKGFTSACVHAGHRSDPNFGHLTPLYATSTYVFESAEQGMRRFNGQEPGYTYGRFGSPTITEVEEKLASLESFGITDERGQPLAVRALLFSSGMAAISALFMATLKAGDKVLTHSSLYGGTDELLLKVLPGLSVTAEVADLREVEQVDQLLARDPKIKLIYVETPANPTMRCVDLQVLCGLAKKHQRLFGCDNTFATPYLQQPFKYGADFVAHSTTKYLNGHGTGIGGVLIGRDSEFMRTAGIRTRRAFGGNSNAFDAFMINNGVKTLSLRLDKHCQNALQVARYLEGHKSIERVSYPGLQSHPDYKIAAQQMRFPGGMLSFELTGGIKQGMSFMNQLKLCTQAVSLGTCDTLLSHPASTTHVGVSEEVRRQYGISDGLIRMSVGIENIEDIVEDLEASLKII